MRYSCLGNRLDSVSQKFPSLCSFFVTKFYVSDNLIFLSIDLAKMFLVYMTALY